MAIATVLVPLCLPSISYAQATFEVLKGFEAPFLHGEAPYAGLIQAADGNFYGTTRGGGAFGHGTIFRLDTAGTLTTLHHFAGGSEGADPYAGVIQAADGTFYGTTLFGGANDSGTIYRLDAAGTLTTLYTFPLFTITYAGLIQAADGSFYGANYYDHTAHDGTIFKLDAAGAFTIVHRFSAPGEGANPFASLIQGPNGSLYGTTLSGGQFGQGTVFKFDPAGTLTTLYHFSDDSHGASPWADLTAGGDGNLYGTTSGGGGTAGTVFKVSAGGIVTTLHAFSGADGQNPVAHVIRSADGSLYGTTLTGPSGLSTIFKLDTAGTLTTLFSFSGEFGGGLYGGIIQALDGNLYGTTAQGPGNGGTLYKFDFVSLTTLHSFWDTSFDGANPYGGLIQGADGNMYGTTKYGGVSGLGSGRGTVFSVDSAGLHTVLHSFGDSSGFPAWPQGPVIQGADGSLYGSTPSGGTGAGVVFRLDGDGTLTPFHFFAGADGYAPHGGVIQSTDGGFYGTATSGGSANAGTIFTLGPTGSLGTVHSFTGGNGSYPDSAPIQASDGNVYGTTVSGGSFGHGTVYKVDAAGTLSTLHHFSGGIDGGRPWAGLIEASDGRLVGTTQYGGAGSAGAVFKIDTAGNMTTLHSFTGPDGAFPIGGVIEGADGSLYGTTSYGGTVNAGTIFRLDAAGALTTLHQFFPASDGRNSYGFLARAADGSFYGTTSEGGPNGGGTVFRLTVASAPTFTFSLSQTLISGCLTGKGTVTLMAPAPAGGTVVSLSSDNAHASVPASVKVAAGASAKSFSIKTDAVAAIEAATIGASIGGAPSTRTLTLKPMGVKSLTLSTSAVVGGTPVSGAVKLECKAGPGPITVTLSSSKPATAAPSPGNVTIPVGMTSAPFVVTTVPVAAIVKAAIKATANGVTKSKTLTVKPAS